MLRHNANQWWNPSTRGVQKREEKRKNVSSPSLAVELLERRLEFEGKERKPSNRDGRGAALTVPAGNVSGEDNGDVERWRLSRGRQRWRKRKVEGVCSPLAHEKGRGRRRFDAVASGDPGGVWGLRRNFRLGGGPVRQSLLVEWLYAPGRMRGSSTSVQTLGPARILLFIAEETDPVGDVDSEFAPNWASPDQCLSGCGQYPQFCSKKSGSVIRPSLFPFTSFEGFSGQRRGTELRNPWSPMVEAARAHFDGLSEIEALFHFYPPIKTGCSHRSIGQIFSLSVHPSHLPDSSPSHPNPKFNICFTSILLSSLNHLISPSRPTDHVIPLFSDAQSVNVRPYKYPHAQKFEIEPKQQPLLVSSPPFEKKDGSWCMCVDYRTLNAITVKDRFPLPTVDELLDELGSARCFSKLDLTYGFHQIRWTLQVPGDAIWVDTDFEQHLSHLNDPHKCSFFQSQITYLGHIVANEGVSPDPAKIQAMVQWLTPQGVKGLCGFLGLTGFYRKFVQNYAVIALPLTNLLKKDNFQWSPAAQSTLEALKSTMTSTSVLVLPDFSKPFYIQRAHLVRPQGSFYFRTIVQLPFIAKFFVLACRNPLHISSAVKRWRQYLLGHPFIIQTDQQSLRELLTQVIQTPEQQHYLVKLLGYDYDIQYKPGKLNVMAEGLSRSLGPSQATLFTLSTPQFVFLRDLKASLLTDPDFIWMRDKGRIWLSNTSQFVPLLLHEFHETPIGGDTGVNKTLKRLSASFYWGSMAKDVKSFVSQCVVCQRMKYNIKQPGVLLQPLPIPTRVWEDITLDLITGLAPSNGYTVLLVVVDRFSKVVHIGALQSNFIAYKVVKLFVSIVCKHHGLPRSIVSDRDPIFISRFWSDLFKFSSTLLRMSSSNHPHRDDQTEVMNRTIEQYLRAFVHHKPHLWFKFFSWVEYHYNTSIHSSSGLSPFEVLFEKQPPSIPHYIEGSSSNDGCDTVLSSREEILSLLRSNLLKAQVRMKKNADAKRRDLNLEVGSWVYIKLQPYRQISVLGNKYHKLSKRYYGPFKVLEKIGPVAYCLELPSHSKIHDVFHCSMLKPHEGPAPSLIDQIPPDATMTIEDTPTRYALVQWKGLSPDDTSWKKWDELKSLFDLEDKVIVEGDGIVTYGNSRPKRMTKRPTFQQFVQSQHSDTLKIKIWQMLFQSYKKMDNEKEMNKSYVKEKLSKTGDEAMI
ncbi:hypothetical protein V8G54_010756 [Vigna mungo]|uniref:Integrase catalytic domain-containing protein n=1 Tax=Vigna mungo TaxID=3915 RepID=A0AAQ3NX90_VIGMU